MELKNSDIKINQYINGELTGKALQEFEQLLENNLELAKEIALHKKIDQTLISKKSNKNKEELNELFQQFGEKYITNTTENETETKVIELNQDNPLPGEKTSKSLLRWLVPVVGIAAAALLIFFIGFGEADPRQLAHQYFEPAIVDFTSRSGIANNLTRAQQAYDNKTYQKALNIFSEYPDNNDALMAKGNCEFLLDKPEKAIATFKQLSDRKIDVHQKAMAKWYLALSFLKFENVNEAKNSLQLIPKDSNYYKDAQTILKKMD